MDWEDGRVMLVACAIVSVVTLINVWYLTKGFKEKKWICKIPICLYWNISIIGFIIAAIGRGPDSMLGLGIFEYAIFTAVFTMVGEGILLIIRKNMD
jgi:hypothetical protein